MIKQGILHEYQGHIGKSLARAATPLTSDFGGQSIVTAQNFRLFQTQKKFLEDELKIFCAKRCISGNSRESKTEHFYVASLNDEKDFTLQNPKFWYNPQIGFWLMGVGDASGRAKSMTKKNSDLGDTFWYLDRFLTMSI